MVDVVELAIKTAFQGADQFAEAGDALRELAKDVNATEREIKSLERELKSLTGLQTLENDLTETTQQLEQAQREARALGQALARTGDTERYSRQLNRASRNVERLTNRQEKLNERLTKTRQRLREAGTFTGNLARDQDRLQEEFRQTTERADKLQASFRKVARSAKEAGQEVRGLGDSTQKINTGLETLGKAGILAIVAELGRQFVNAASGTESLQKALELVTGSSEAAAAELEFVRDTANQLGLEVTQTADAYLGLVAAARGTALEGQETREIFFQVSNAMARLGRSSADTEGALRSIEQIISKNTVSAEELRGQLGERLFGSFQAAARAIGVTTEELDDLLRRGGLVADDLLPALSDELERLYDTGERVDTVEGAWNRFTNALVRVTDRANETLGVTEAVKLVLDDLALSVDGASTVLNRFAGVASDLISLPFEDANERNQVSFENLGETANNVLNVIRNVGSALAETGTQSREAANAWEDARQNLQNLTFNELAQELATLNSEEGLDGFIRRVIKLRAENAITEQQFVGILNAFRQLRQELQQGAGETEQQTDATDQQTDSNQNLTESTKTATEAQIAQTDAIGGGLSALAIMTDVAEQTAARLGKLSEEAENLFRVWLEATRGQEIFSVAALRNLTETTSEAAELNREISTLGGLIRQAQQDVSFASNEVSEWFKTVELQSLLIEKAFLQQKQGAEAAIAQLEQLESAGESVIAQAQGMVDSYRLLDDQTLSRLQSEVDRLQQANERLEESAESALRRYQDLVDEQEGNRLAIAERKRADALLDLEEQLAEARAAGNAEAIRDLEQALALARVYHAEELARLGQRLAGERAITAERNRGAGGAPGLERLPAPAGPDGGAPIPAGPGPVPINILLNGQKVGELTRTELLRSGYSTVADFRMASMALGASQS